MTVAVALSRKTTEPNIYLSSASPWPTTEPERSLLAVHNIATVTTYGISAPEGLLTFSFDPPCSRNGQRTNTTRRPGTGGYIRTEVERFPEIFRGVGKRGRCTPASRKGHLWRASSKPQRRVSGTHSVRNVRRRNGRSRQQPANPQHHVLRRLRHWACRVC